ncbi:hypothetical protein NKG99_34130 [Mesorhizobium sp. M1409]|uniref:hypothetical protein n=1 Tax=unclassified Mesorhizobium TaxID=325217 RepID=UPI00333659E7
MLTDLLWGRHKHGRINGARRDGITARSITGKYRTVKILLSLYEELLRHECCVSICLWSLVPWMQYPVVASSVPSLARSASARIQLGTRQPSTSCFVDINAILAWLGHVSLDTTHIYAQFDLEMTAKALASVDIDSLSGPPRQRTQQSLMAFLKAL